MGPVVIDNGNYINDIIRKHMRLHPVYSKPNRIEDLQVIISPIEPYTINSKKTLLDKPKAVAALDELIIAILPCILSDLTFTSGQILELDAFLDSLSNIYTTAVLVLDRDTRIAYDLDYDNGRGNLPTTLQSMRYYIVANLGAIFTTDA